MGKGEQADTRCSNSRTKHSDAVWISSKEANVLADPPQCLDLVQEPIVSFCSLVTCAEETWNTDTIKNTSVALITNENIDFVK